MRYSANKPSWKFLFWYLALNDTPFFIAKLITYYIFISCDCHRWKGHLVGEFHLRQPLTIFIQYNSNKQQLEKKTRKKGKTNLNQVFQKETPTPWSTCRQAGAKSKNMKLVCDHQTRWKVLIGQVGQAHIGGLLSRHLIELSKNK